MLRNEIAEQDKWDLTPVYPDVDAWNAAYQQAEQDIQALPEVLAKMTDSAEALYAAAKMLTKVGTEEVERLYTYAHLRYSEDTTNNEARQLMGRVQNLATAYSSASAPFDPTLLTLSAEQLEAFFKACPALEEEYGILLRDQFRYKPYVLSEPEEKLLAAFRKERETAEETYETLTSSDLRFGTIKGESGEQEELTDTNYAMFMRSPDREVRKAAFTTLYKTYDGFRNTFAALYAGQIEAEKTVAQVRGYGSALEASLYADHMTPEMYGNMVSAVSGHLDVLFRYYRLKKKVFGLDEMHMYDIYLPLNTGKRRHFTYAEAVGEVLAACSIFGEEYVSILQQGYRDRWVDVYPNTGKVGGAFSGGSATTNPYILLNFQGLDDDVSTLAHESGHSMHSYYTRLANPVQYADYTIFVAEVPSTVNELVLAYHRLESTDDREEKLAILGSLLELYKGTIYRQIMFAEFEQITHALSEAGEVLTADLLCEKYYALNEKYFGGEIVLDKEIAREWMRIPHFYYNFYVYKYAVGLSAASHIVRRIRNGEPDALESYFRFLKLGNTKDPIESLKVAGVDMTRTDAFDSAVAIFDELITEYETLYDEEN
ncbi:MAG: oligoendopeptidase F [Oscillospiraceae bacterium]|nr:oligoendopeptidase F [Oscillospiraceae bacterium]